ncbi:MAG TPA: class I SAM-dependent methyltransferase, partial [Streptosporangiaceae bacterium]
MSLWSDRSFLRDVQYQTDANLTARQSIYAYQQPPADLTSQILDVVLPAGAGAAGVIADVGCGNGLFLAELARRGHGRRLIGADLSPGMLRGARERTRQAGWPEPALVAADAAALPFRDSSADLTLAMHMLYHVPEPEVALRELRRVT